MSCKKARDCPINVRRVDKRAHSRRLIKIISCFAASLAQDKIWNYTLQFCTASVRNTIEKMTTVAAEKPKLALVIPSTCERCVRMLQQQQRPQWDHIQSYSCCVSRKELHSIQALTCKSIIRALNVRYVREHYTFFAATSELVWIFMLHCCWLKSRSIEVSHHCSVAWISKMSNWNINVTHWQFDSDFFALKKTLFGLWQSLTMVVLVSATD